MGERNTPGGPHLIQESGRCPPLLGAPPVSWTPWWAPGVHLLLYEGFYPGKNRGLAYGMKLRRHEAEPWWNQSRAPAELYPFFGNNKPWSTALSATTRRNLGGTNLELRQSCSAGDTSFREGEIITVVITDDPLVGRGSIFINIFTSTISSQTLVHLLYPILYPKPQIGTCGLLVVLITPCS